MIRRMVVRLWEARMWSSAAWSAVIFAYVAVLLLGIVCETVRAKRRKRSKKPGPTKDGGGSADVIGFR